MNKHISIVVLWLFETSQIPIVCISTDAFDDGSEKYVVNKLHLDISFFVGDILRWEQQVRLRHFLTRQYLCIDSKMDVSLVTDPSDPRTVFRLHSVLKAWE